MSSSYPPREGGRGPGPDAPIPLGSEADPGYLRSATAGGALGALRLVGAVMAVSPVLLLVVSVSVIGTEVAWSPLGLFLPSVGLVCVALATVLPPVRPLSPETTPEAAVARSVERLRGATFVKLALCEAPALLGFVSMFAFDSSLVPFLVGMAISLIGFLTVGLPTTGAVERFRERLERDGATSYLWFGLLRGTPSRF